jgi:DNA-binding response OmpR family regulator
MSTDRKRILCVEDDPDSCALLAILLGDYDVSTATTVRKAVELARTGGFDLYVLNGKYPDGSGIELCLEIRSFDAAVPILFFSGLAEETTIQEALTAGAQSYLIKPDEIELLRPRVEELLTGGTLCED